MNIEIDKQNTVSGGLIVRWRPFTPLAMIKIVLMVPIMVFLWMTVIRGMMQNPAALFYAVPLFVVPLGLLSIPLLWLILRCFFGKEFLQLDENGLLLESTVLFCHTRVSIPLEQICGFETEGKQRLGRRRMVYWTELNVIMSDGKKRQVISDFHGEPPPEQRVAELQPLCDEFNAVLRTLQAEDFQDG